MAKKKRINVTVKMGESEEPTQEKKSLSSANHVATRGETGDDRGCGPGIFPAGQVGGEMDSRRRRRLVCQQIPSFLLYKYVA